METVETRQEQPQFMDSLNIKLPSEDGILKFYDEGDHLAWFSFPMEVKVPSGDALKSRVGDERSDYVCHRLVKDRLEIALTKVYEFLGAETFRAEGWDIFGGGYQKDGTDAERLALKFIFNPSSTIDEPKFSDDAVDIMERYGFLNLGRATGKNFGTFVAYVPNYDQGDYYAKLGLPKHIKVI